MARNRENRPELDYDLLVERHERFRSRHPQTKTERPSDRVAANAGQTPEKAKAQPAAAPEATEAVAATEAPAQEAVADDVEKAVDAVEAADVAAADADVDAVDDYDYDYDEEDEEGEEEDGEEEAVDPNPFGSILSFLSRSRDAIGNKLRRKHEDANEDYEDYDEEDEEDEEDGLEPAGNDALSESDADTAQGDAHEAADAQDVPSDAPADVADLFDIPAADADAQGFLDADEEEGDALDEEDDEDVAEDDEEEDENASESALTRFLHLFVDRNDDEDEEDGDGEAYDGGFDDENEGEFVPYIERQQAGGEISMDEPRKVETVDTEMTQLMAEGLGERTLSRRERRELQKRQEAAPENAAHEESAPAQDDGEEGVDEPTREFMPISRERAARSVEPPVSLFADEDEEEEEEEIEPPISRRAQRRAEKARRLEEEEDEDDYDDEDDEDEDYEEEPKKRRHSRSARRDDPDDEDDDEDDEDDYDEEPRKKRLSRSARRRDDYDDEDDEDDYDDYEDEDEDDDYDEPRSHRGGRGHRHQAHSRRDDYDDYDDEDDYDDYDEDDYDDDYDDDERRSFGHYLLGFFKAVALILLVLILAVFGMNLLHFTGAVDISGMRDTVNGWSPSIADALFFAVGEEAPEAAGTEQDATLNENADLPALEDGAEEAAAPDAAQAGEDAQSGLAPVAPAA